MKRFVALTLAMLIFFSSIHPPVYALTSGPSQPEFSSFTPFEQSSLVDHFSGDFKYNIPLMEVEGYPINLAYESGVTQESEASWVGLGWSLNPGAINRSVRGLPDDFNGNGDKLTTDTEMKAREVFEVKLTVKPNAEIVGYPLIKGKGKKSKKPGKPGGGGLIPSMTFGVSFDNYYGLGFKFGMPLTTNLDLGKATANLGLNIGYSSSDGYNLSPSLSLQAKEDKTKEKTTGKDPLSISLGTSYNNEQGFTGLQFSQNKIAPKLLGEGYIPFGSSSYTPQLQNNKKSLTIGGDFGFGVELFWFAGKVNLAGNYSKEEIRDKHKEARAYGYLYHHNASPHEERVITDYNRESDAVVTKELPLLPVAHATFDYYSVTGQGLGGNYRPHRGEAIPLFDEPAEHKSDGYDLGVEIAATNYFKGAANLSANFTVNRSGAWNELGEPSGLLNNIVPYTSRSVEAFDAFNKYTSTKSETNYEPVCFKKTGELNESDQSFFDRFHGTNAAAIDYRTDGEFKNNLVYSNGQGGRIVGKSISNNRQSRMTRTQTFDYLTATEAAVGALEKQIKLTNVATAENRVGAHKLGHHISEVKVMREDGFKFYYGIPVYQLKKIERVCSVGAAITNDVRQKQKIGYSSTEMSKGNNSGVDEYFQETQTSPYATSYLLTAMVSPDYADVNDNGPSTEDIGTYVKFNYKRTHGVGNACKWRTPLDANQGNLTEGNYSTNKDNKTVVTYGEKEVYYLSNITTKNYVAEFYTSLRSDAREPLNINGGIAPSSTLHKLDSIRLFSLSERVGPDGANAVPIKTVYFVYDYSLCKLTPNGKATEGKLTLKKVYFTYRNSPKGALNPYVFSYAKNPDYAVNAQDIWGNYAKQVTSSEVGAGKLSNSEFPYVDQSNAALANERAASWLLSDIKMPTGGNIKVDYESDSYAFVQAERAMQMIKIKGFSDKVISDLSQLSADKDKLFKGKNPNNYIYFDIDPAIAALGPEAFQKAYTRNVDKLYFRCFIDMTSTGNAEFVSGFAKTKSSGMIAGLNVGWIRLEDVYTEEKRANAPASPIAKLAWQMMRKELNDLINPPITAPGSFKDALERIKNEVRKLYALSTGVNASLRDFNHCRKVNLEKSFIRLQSPNLNKFGGGSRVAKLTFTDNWGSMPGQGLGYKTGTYGYTYKYTTDHKVFGTISSGVASWEPQQGGDENPYRQPLAYTIDRILAPNENLVRELPAGEALYPDASVGYSRVEVQEIKTDLRSKGVGKNVYEYYTAKDFPVQSRQIGPFITPQSQLLSKLLKIFKLYSTSKLYASQGLSLEFSNMHGVAKSEEIYAEDNSTPITKTEYFYKSVQTGTNTYGDPIYRLENMCDVIRSNTNVEKSLLGVDYDVVCDFREYRSADEMDRLALNLDISGLAFIIIPVFTGYPGMELHRSIMRTASILKTTTRYPILERVVKTDLSSRVTEHSLFYDAKTGTSLVTSLQNQFNDTYYKVNVPAYWVYNEMGPSYEKSRQAVTVSISGGVVTSSSVPVQPGDILINNSTKYWVIKDGSSTKLVDFDGTPAASSVTGKIIQPAARNQLNQSMMTFTTKSNPVASGKLRLMNSSVIDATGIEYNSASLSDCACAKDANNTNPYVNGKITAFQPVSTYKYLTGRKYTGDNVNTMNMRNDGTYSFFSPLWNFISGKWTFKPNGWVAENTVVLRNPNNAEIESKDAINQYSSTLYTYNQKIPKAMAKNARYQQVFYEHFEEDDNAAESNCMDKAINLGPSYSSTDKAHSGKKAIKVAPKSNATVKFNVVCPQ